MTMRAPAGDWATDFDHLDPRWIEDPYPIWREMRQTCPIAHTDRFQGAYFPSRYADIRAIAYDTEHFSSSRLFLRDEKGPLPKTPPLTSDPPEHRAQRMVLLPHFTPEATKRLEPRVRAFCRELATRLSRQDFGDGALDYAQEIPARVTAEMLGISAQSGELFRRWIYEFMVLGITDPMATIRVVTEMEIFFAAQIALRRKLPGDDLISHLLGAKIDGMPLSDDHINGTLRLLLFAGIDTTWCAIGAALWHLATHPEDRLRLAGDPQLIPTAVEEFLRAYAPVTMAREIVKDTEIGGCPMKAGEMVVLPFPVANRDPAVFPDPERVILDRAPNRHAAFGLGIHRCIGAGLARMEMTVALEEWLAAIPEFRLASNADVQWSAGAIRGPHRLPLLFR